MKKIEYSNTGNVIAGLSGIICAVSVYSFATNPNPMVKNFALNAGMLTGGVAIAAKGIDKLSRDSINYQIRDIAKEHENLIEGQKKTIGKLSAENIKQRESIRQLRSELENKQAIIFNLQNFTNALKAQTESKLKELSEKLGLEDGRYQEFKDAIKQEFWKLTRDRIDIDYERMGETIEKKLNAPEYENIHDALTKFQNTLYQQHRYHCEKLSEISELDGDPLQVARDATNIFFDVSDQTAALKVRLRNLLNLDERLALDGALEELEIRRDPTKFVSTEKVKTGLDFYKHGNAESIKRLEDMFRLNKSDFEDLREQVADLLDEIDNKNLQIQKLKDEVRKLQAPKPFYGGGTIAKVGNAINTFYYEKNGYKLDAVDWEENDTGYSLVFSIRNNPGLTEKELAEDNGLEKLASFTNALYKTMPKLDFNYQHCLLTITVKTRRAIEVPTTNDAMYKQGLIPADQFCDRIYKALDTKQQGKPTLRVMAATGEGKGIALKNLLAYWVNQPGWEIWLSDPVDGSDEDYWDTPKIAADPIQAGIAYNSFVELHRARINQSPAFTDKFVLAVFDEFDKQHDDDDKESALAIMTAIRHTKQRQILIGQCAEVGKNKWTWDDMNNCAMLVLGNSIGTLCKHLAKDMGWSTNRANTVKKEYEKFSDWARKNNDSNPDIPGENQYRIGLLVVSGRYEFLEIPSAHKGIIRSGQALIRESLSINTQKAAISNNLDSPFQEVSEPVVDLKIQCPHCGSDDFKRHSEVKDSSQYRYLCKNPECKKTFVAKRF